MIGQALARYFAASKRFVWEEHPATDHRIRVRRAITTPEASTPAIVLLPGLALSGHYMLPVGAELARRLPVYVPDLPGYARTSPRAALDMPELADVVVAWMDHLGLDPVVVVGNSMGCQVAVEMAVRHPQRVSHIVLEGPTVDAEARSIIRNIGRLLIARNREPSSLGPLQATDWIKTGPSAIIGTIRHMFAHHIEDLLGRVRCPALVIRGGQDPIVPEAWARRVAGGMPHGSFVHVPDGGHALTYSDPRELAAIIDGFLAGTATH